MSLTYSNNLVCSHFGNTRPIMELLLGKLMTRLITNKPKVNNEMFEDSDHNIKARED
jgi:hypothetical protein